MKKNTLQYRFFYFNVLFIIIITILIGVFSYLLISKAVGNEIGERALSIAHTTANREDIKIAFESNDPSATLQPIALSIQQQTGAAYVVIGNKEEIRYAHPNTEKIGNKMVGDDNDKALIEGLSYITYATGTLGEAVRGKSPVKNQQGEIVGVVSVGFLQTKITSTLLSYGKYISLIIIIVIILGVIGARILSNRIKKDLLDYEPIEIAKILMEQKTLIESVREGIIMVNDKGIITLINQSATNTIFDGELVLGRSILDVIPNTQLIKVMKSQQQQLDRPMYINGKKTIVNRKPIFDGENVIGAVSSFRLQSEIDLLADELSQVTQYIESLRAQTHEYNNFLYTISGLIQLQSYKEALELIHTERIGNRSLIYFMSQRIKDTYLSGIIIGFYNRAKELKVNLQLDESSYCKSLTKQIEKHLIISILGNLVTNAFEAVEHLPEQHRLVRLYIFDHGNELIFEVEDSGKGITPEDMDTIFTKKQSTKDKKLRGYGLHIVKQNLLELSGTISIEKGDLGGALFIVSIPKEVINFEPIN